MVVSVLRCKRCLSFWPGPSSDVMTTRSCFRSGWSRSRGVGLVAYRAFISMELPSWSCRGLPTAFSLFFSIVGFFLKEKLKFKVRS